MAGWAWLWLALSLGAAWLFIWASFYFFSGLLAVLVAIPIATLPTLLAVAASGEVILRGMRRRRHPFAVASGCLSLVLAVAVPIIIWSALT
jgi:ABC-type proline/glycine betaine transport system permease subunit